jgi:hypothetical protein
MGKGSSLAGGLPPSEHQKRDFPYDNARTEPSSQLPSKTRRSLAPDNRRVRSLRLRASGLQRLATAPSSRRPARGALRFSGPVLGRRPSALSALERSFVLEALPGPASGGAKRDALSLRSLVHLYGQGKRGSSRSLLTQRRSYGAKLRKRKM